MNTTEYKGIKDRHAAAAEPFPSEILDEDFARVLDTQITSESSEFIKHSHEDVDKLTKEYDRFRANFEAALSYLDNFMQHHANVLPRQAADDLRGLQARMRGLL